MPTGLGHLTCKTVSPDSLYCDGGDVKPCSLTFRGTQPY